MSHAPTPSDPPLAEFAARVLAADIAWRAGEPPHALIHLLEEARPEHVALLDPEQLYDFWTKLEKSAASHAITLLPLLPAAVRARIDDSRTAGLLLKLTGAQLRESVGRLDGTLRHVAESLLMHHWRENPAEWLRHAWLLPAELCEGVPPELVQEGWATCIAPDRVAAVRLLSVLPPVLEAHIPSDAVERLLPDPREMEADAAALQPPDLIVHLSAVISIPERFITERVAAFMQGVFRTLASRRQSWEVEAVLQALVQASPAGLRRVPAEEARALWMLVARSSPGVALDALWHLPAGYVPEVTAAEVERLWEWSIQHGPYVEDLSILSAIPPRLRPWASEARVRDIARRACEHSSQDYPLESIEEVAPDLQPFIDEAQIARLIANVGGHDAAEWLQKQAARIERGEVAWPALTQQVYRIFAENLPRTALRWLARQSDALRLLIPHALRMEAWRAWAASRDEPGRSYALGDALEWAGVDAAAHGLRTSGTGLVAPAEFRPAALGDELSRAVLEAIEYDGAWGFQLLERLPDALRPKIDQPQVQDIWERLLARPRLYHALAVIECAPEALRPRPTAEQMAVLLGSKDADVRLAAIRLNTFAPGGPEHVEWGHEGGARRPRAGGRR
jgi:hypothetical protein